MIFKQEKTDVKQFYEMKRINGKQRSVHALLMEQILGRQLKENIELYTDKKNPGIESPVEAVLDKRSIFYGRI